LLSYGSKLVVCVSFDDVRCSFLPASVVNTVFRSTRYSVHLARVHFGVLLL
jgi:hypothetical protein